FIQNELSGPIDIMLEVKDKNRSAEKIQLYLDQDIGAAEKLWARYKYDVMAKSLNIYHAIRNLLKDKEHTDFEAFIQYLETAENLPEDIGDRKSVVKGKRVKKVSDKNGTEEKVY